MNKFDVIVCGSLHLDIVVKAPALPRIDETAVGSSWAKVCGGKGGNQAVQAARAGARTAMIGRIGDDDFGQTLLKNLTTAKVDVSAITTDQKQGSGMSVAILQVDGDYGAVIVSGSNTTIDPRSLADQWSALGGAKVLVLQNEVPHEVNLAAARAAKAAGADVVFNAAPARARTDELAGLIDVFIVNRIEAEAMCGQTVQSRSDARRAISAMTKTFRAVVITLGGEGLVLSNETQAIHEIEPILVEVVSTHGAGDCFVGTLSAELANGGSLLSACQRANQRAATFVSQANKETI